VKAPRRPGGRPSYDGRLAISRSLHAPALSLLILLALGVGAPERARAGPQAAWADRREAVIGCAFPLSGPEAVVGRRALRGVLIAAAVFGEDGPGFPLSVAVRDTGGTPAGAARAVTELVRDEGAVAIVGPLTSRESPGAAVMAQKLHVPILTLTQREGIIAAGDYVFRSLLTPVDEARAIALYAVERLHLTRLAILHPNDRFGRALAEAFRQEASSRGARVVQAFSYRQFNDLQGLTDRMFSGSGWAAAEPPGWDGVFIPDGVSAARVVADRLRRLGRGRVRILGTGLWNTREAAQSQALEGAVFAAAFSEESPAPATRRFANAYRRTFGEAPDALSAQAHDAAALLVELLRRRPDSGPEHLRARIERASGIEGAAGSLAFDGQRDARRGALILSVRDGRIAPVEMDIGSLTWRRSSAGRSDAPSRPWEEPGA
jgi:branched-chain amino acid transport system substrate-binding protein